MLGSKHLLGRRMHIGIELMIPNWAPKFWTRMLDLSKTRTHEDQGQVGHSTRGRECLVVGRGKACGQLKKTIITLGLKVDGHFGKQL